MEGEGRERWKGREGRDGKSDGITDACVCIRVWHCRGGHHMGS